MASPYVVLVTGGNNGIGYEACKAFYESPKSYIILMGSRSLEKGEAAIRKIKEVVPNSSNTLELIQLDVTSDESIQKAYEQILKSPGRLDALVNNAGATFDFDYNASKVTLRECFNKAYDVNVTGATVLTHTLAPLLIKSSDPRLLFIAGLSMMTVAMKEYFPTPPLPAGWPKKVEFETIGYRCSKTALNMLMLDWNHKLKADKVKVWAVGPGMLETDLGGQRELAKKMGLGSATLGGTLIRDVVEGARDQDVGRVIQRDGDGFVPL
ncbi:uncharacterized protein ANIA_07999 [Aspergillus nidulans FGSC A4]|uniref:Uncharacterized protein n=1 Tax=Emericella nidulans (strain FGSC A4 / ATCC 38163 / CBS 112.46 / NRRL 194 / M139) TaxID=227321 RepID=C8V5M0_EMENI|nr:hypothetical protein [Aspergillus nidulans FGSC A4]CBF73678.1 TPA: conserved hypothetical protein [Aspergillus nidulans FGSC A4]